MMGQKCLDHWHSVNSSIKDVKETAVALTVDRKQLQEGRGPVLGKLWQGWKGGSQGAWTLGNRVWDKREDQRRRIRPEGKHGECGVAELGR